MERKLLQAQKKLMAMRQEFKVGDNVVVGIMKLGAVKRILTGTVIFSGPYFMTVKSETSGAHSYNYVDMLLGDIIIQKKETLAA